MAREMKVHTVEKTESVTAEIWYDPSYMWVARLIDNDGNQIGEADYLGGVGRKSAEMAAKALLLWWHNDNKDARFR